MSTRPLPVQDVSQLGIFRTKPLDATELFVWPWVKFFQTLEQFRINAPQFFFTGHASRTKLNPQNVSIGTLFFETDRNVLYISNGSTWQYVAGVFSAVLAALPSDLTSTDAGFLVNVTDYNHLLQWSGSSWGWGPGDFGGGFTVPFVNPPTSMGWHAADGSTVNQLQPNGGISPVVVPNTAGSYFRQ